MTKNKFKVGDKVKVKVKNMFSVGSNFRLGSSPFVENEFEAMIMDIDIDDKEAFVRFENGATSWIDFDNLMLIKSAEIKKTKLITPNYKAGMSISDYVKKLLKIEKDKERIKWLRTFDNCVLPIKVREIIEEALTIVLRADVFEKWGINDHFEKGLTNSILIYGPPGTGKTMVSESIASILGLNLMKLTNADIQSNIPGRTEKNISESFEKAKSDNAVIMLDECDSILYNRNAVGSILAAEINHLLMEIERFSGVVLLTTNRLHKLDEALQRRIIAKVELPLPDKDSRKKIWQKLIPEKMPTEDLDFTRLSISKLSGGEIKNAILLSARKTISQNRKKVIMSDFLISIDTILKSKKDFEDVQPTRFDKFEKTIGKLI